MKEQSRRQVARKILRSYPSLQRKKASGVELTAQERDAINAVNITIMLQDERSSGADRIRILTFVYFNKSRTLEGAALACGCSIDAAKKWNAEILTAVSAALEGMRINE